MIIVVNCKRLNYLTPKTIQNYEVFKIEMQERRYWTNTERP